MKGMWVSLKPALLLSKYLFPLRRWLVSFINYHSTSTLPEKSLGLGWKPFKTQKDWEESIRESFEAIVHGEY